MIPVQSLLSCLVAGQVCASWCREHEGASAPMGEEQEHNEGTPQRPNFHYRCAQLPGGVCRANEVPLIPDHFM